MRRSLTLIICSIFSLYASAGSEDLSEQVRDWRKNNEQLLVDRFSELLSIPNVASDTLNIRRNANHIMAMMEQAGMNAELLELDGGNPAVFAERQVAGAEKTILIYVHYDGQPVNPADWASDPWTPVMRDAMVENGGIEDP